MYLGSLLAQRSEQAILLLDFFNEFFLQQYVQEPRRGNNMLDLFAANDDYLYEVFWQIETLYQT